MRTSISIIIALLFIQSVGFSQEEPIKDSLLSKHSPALASGLSALIPGAGQCYNKKYWKVPIIYAGAGTVAYLFQRNLYFYNYYRDAYLMRIDPCNPDKDPLFYMADDNLITLQDQYRKYIELCVIGGIMVYVLNVVDAAVDAHLYTFNVSDDLSMNILPEIGVNTYGLGTASLQPQLKIQFQF